MKEIKIDKRANKQRRRKKTTRQVMYVQTLEWGTFA
jgi:hypothetical protein